MITREGNCCLQGTYSIHAKGDDYFDRASLDEAVSSLLLLMGVTTNRSEVCAQINAEQASRTI